MDIRSLTFGGLVIGGWSLIGRQDLIFGGKHHGGALVIWPLRILGEDLAFTTSRRASTGFLAGKKSLFFGSDGTFERSISITNTRFAWAGGTCPCFTWAGGTFFLVVLL